MLISNLVPGITFIRYAQNRKIGKPNNLKFLGTIKPKGQNRLREENLSYFLQVD
jgi:hypothetical protein